jgi:hypothetical protein
VTDGMAMTRVATGSAGLRGWSGGPGDCRLRTRAADSGA